MNKLLSALAILGIGLVLLVPAVILLVMSMKAYLPVRGLVCSPFVGPDNIIDVLVNPNMGRVLGNTLVISVLALVIGALYLLAAFHSIGVTKNFTGKLVLTCLYVLPAVIPANAYNIMLVKLLPTQVLTNSSILLQIIAAAQTGLRFSAVFVIAALFVKKHSMNEVLRYVLLYVAVRLIRILTLDTAFLNGFSNPLTYEHLDTYGTWSYRTGLMQAQFSGYAGRYVVGLMLQLVPAIVGVVLLGVLFRERSRSRNHTNAGNTGGFSPVAVTVIVPLVLLLLVVIAGAEGSLGFEYLRVAQSYGKGIFIAAFSSVVVVACGMILANAALGLKTVGICLVAFLYFISDDLLGSFFVIRSLGMFNTLMGIVLQNMHWIAPAGLIGALILQSNYSIKKVLAVSVAALGIGFAWFWGDHTSAMVIVSSADHYPVSYVMQQMASGAAEVQISALLYIIVPVLVSGAGIVAGGLINESTTEQNKCK